MTTGSFTVGRDAQAVFIAPNGTRLDFSLLTEFSWKPEYKTARSDPLNDAPLERFLPAGHRLMFNVDRNGPANDALISQIEQGWWAVGSADSGTSNNGTIYVYITELDGSATTYQGSGVSIKMTNGGDFKTDSPIKQSYEGFARKYQKV